MKKNVLDWLERTAAEIPNKTAYQSVDMQLTFLETQEQAKRIGSGIIANEITSKPIAVILDKEVTTIAAFLGVVYSGHAYAPIDITLPDSRIEKILNCLQPSMIITEEHYSDRINCLIGRLGLQVSVRDIDELRKTGINEEKLALIREHMVETDPLYVIFTSGSSGTPKGVITSHHSLMCYIDAYVDVMGIDRDDRLGNQSPLDYIAAIRDIYIPLYKGASSYLIPKNYFMQMDKLSNLIREQQITALGWSTSAIVLLTSFGITDNCAFGSIKKVCFSGSVMPGSILRKWQKMLPETLFVNQYGPTEATASCTYYIVDHLVEADENIPIGKPYKNYRIFILREDGTEAGTGEEGEICVGGPILALGYYNNLQKTKEDFIQNPLNTFYEEKIYKTGDIGELKQDGNIYFHGRKDRQIKMMGHRVELDEIEAAATIIPKMSECSAMYLHEQETIYLFYSGETTIKEIVIELRKQLPGFMIPRKIIKMDALPKLPNGKIDMTTLRNKAERGDLL